MKKLSLTCQSALEEEKQKLQEEDPDLADLLTDEFLLEYQRKRMKEMIARAEKMRFGTVLNLTDSEQFLDCIDKEDKSVTIVVHVYEEDIPGCDAMNGSLVTLAQEYPHVKFCKIMGRLKFHCHKNVLSVFFYFSTILIIEIFSQDRRLDSANTSKKKEYQHC